MDDRQIVQLYWDRDETALTETAQAYGSYCHAIAYRILQSEQDAQECVNDTYWKAWNSIPPQRPQRLATYLGKITRNLSINRLDGNRARKRGNGQLPLALEELEECIPSGDSMDTLADEIVLSDAISHFLRAQPQTERRIFVGRYWHMYSVAELAQNYGMRQSTVASLLLRMRKRLKAYLEKEDIFV